VNSLQPWAEDVAEQLAVAGLIYHSSEPAVRRIALIIVDNAVEVALKTYVEFEKGIAYFGLKKKDWEENYKDNFRRILNLVVTQEKLTANQLLILGFHDTRNQLYHDPKLLSIESKDVKKYLDEGKSLFNRLFSSNLSDAAWESIGDRILGVTFPRSEGLPTKISVTRRDDGSLKVEGIATLNDTTALMVVMQKFLETEGKPATLGQLTNTLKSSGKSLSNPAATIGSLRKQRLIKNNELTLTPKGQKRYSKFLS
jgi:hypothetical protein